MSNYDLEGQALVTTAEAAELLEVHVSTVNKWVVSGRLRPAVKAPGLRGARLFRRADVQALTEAAS